MPIHRPEQTVRETPTHVLTLPLDVEPWQAADLGKTFEAARLLYNSLVRYFVNYSGTSTRASGLRQG